MQDRLEARLAALRKEFEAGRAELQDLEARQVRVRETMLRIAGAVQVLEELLEADGEAVAATEARSTPAVAAHDHSVGD